MAGLLIGLGLLLLAGVIGLDAAGMDVPRIHAKVGPRVFPVIVSCGLAISGLLTILTARRGDFPVAEGDTDWRAVAIMGAGLVLHLNVLKPLGFIPAGVILFMSVTLAFGSRNYGRDCLVGVVLASLAYFGFTKLLGLQLPPGLLKGLI